MSFSIFVVLGDLEATQIFDVVLVGSRVLAFSNPLQVPHHEHDVYRLQQPSLPESVAASASVPAVLTHGASSQVNTQPTSCSKRHECHIIVLAYFLK